MTMNSLLSGCPGVRPALKGYLLSLSTPILPRAQGDHALDGDEGKGEEPRAAAPDVVWIVEGQEIGDLALDEEAVGIHPLQIDQEDLLEQRGRPLPAVALDHEERPVVRRR